MRQATGLLDLLEGVGPIDMRVALVVAHPDDETIAMSGTMARFTKLVLIHVTDGAPDRLSAQSRESREPVADIRRAEVAAALKAAMVRNHRQMAYGMTDGGVADTVVELAERLERDLASVDAVLTHPYEGGHIDHDVCALAVQSACGALIGRGAKAPDRLEFASYHNRRGRVVSGRFWPDPLCRELSIDLKPGALQRRTAAFACHSSQEKNLRFFSLHTESFREAPRYDFAALPPPGNTFYGKDGEVRFARALDAMATAGKASV